MLTTFLSFFNFFGPLVLTDFMEEALEAEGEYFMEDVLDIAGEVILISEKRNVSVIFCQVNPGRMEWRDWL